MFNQSFELHDLIVVGLLVVLEGVLSIDNALVLGLLAKRLPKPLQSRALTYGLVGAFVFRLIAIAAAAYLLHWRWVKILGGGYLVYIAVKHLFFEAEEPEAEHITATTEGEPVLVHTAGDPITAEEEDLALKERVPLPAAAIPGRMESTLAVAPAFSKEVMRKFWSAILVIELTDIAFAIDSILAAIALVGDAPTRPHPKLWVVFTGGMLGVILMRFAAVVFIKLLERFPRFETAAYLLVIVIGVKLLLDWYFNADPHHPRLDFHSYHSGAFWAFWITMLICFCIGFIPQRQTEPKS